MPAILIDLSRLLFRRLTNKLPTGIDRITIEYSQHYRNRARAVVSLGIFSAVLSARQSAHAFDLALGLKQLTSWRYILLIFIGYFSWLRRAPVAGDVLFNTDHKGLEFARYASGLVRRGARAVIFLHDLIPLTHSEFCRPGERGHHERRVRNALIMAQGIIVNSQDTLTELTRFAARSNLPLPPAVVAPLASGLPAYTAGPRPIAQPYFVMVGSIEPRKNHWMLLNIWRRMVECTGALAPRLVIIGQRGWECENVVDLLERCEPLKGVVIEKGACTDAELVTYLRHAQALLLPSFTEGFGIPIVEALSLGTPVIASDLAVFREIAADIPEYVDPLDGPKWMSIITEYARPGSAARTAQCKRMAGFVPKSWADHLGIVDRFIEQLPSSR